MIDEEKNETELEKILSPAHIVKIRNDFLNRPRPKEEDIPIIKPLTREDIERKFQEYQQRYKEMSDETEEINQFPWLETAPLLGPTFEQTELETLSQRATNVTRALVVLGQYHFADRFELMGAILATTDFESTQLGLDQRSILLKLDMSGKYKLGHFNGDWEAFTNSSQQIEDLQLFFLQSLAQEEQAKKEAGPINDLTLNYVQKAIDYLKKRFTQKKWKLPSPQSIFFQPSLSIYSYSLITNDANNDKNGDLGGTSVAGMINTTLGQFISTDILYFLVQGPTYLKQFTDEENIQKQALRTASTIIHETIHGQKEMSKDQPKYQTTQLANELITDYATLIAISHGENYDNDWYHKTGYLAYMQLAFVLQRKDIFGQEAITEDDLLNWGLEQNWKGFRSAVDTRLEKMSEEDRNRFIEEIDRLLLIGPEGYEKLKASPSFSFQDVAHAMLEQRNAVGQMAYQEPGWLLEKLKGPNQIDLTSQEVAKYFLGTREQGISEEIRREKHKLLRDYIKRRKAEQTPAYLI